MFHTSPHFRGKGAGARGRGEKLTGKERGQKTKHRLSPVGKKKTNSGTIAVPHGTGSKLLMGDVERNRPDKGNSTRRTGKKTSQLKKKEDARARKKPV